MEVYFLIAVIKPRLLESEAKAEVSAQRFIGE
jgi:hypothetical protein